MTISFSISRPDSARLRYRVQETRRRSKDLKGAFRRAAPKVRKEIDRWFESEGGGRWAPLALATIRARMHRWGYYKHGFREGPTHRILHARHELRQSLTRPGGKHLSRITKRTWTMGSRLKRAAFLHRGDSSGATARPMPPRRLVPRDKLGPIVAGEVREHVLHPWRQSYGGR